VACGALLLNMNGPLVESKTPPFQGVRLSVQVRYGPPKKNIKESYLMSAYITFKTKESESEIFSISRNQDVFSIMNKILNFPYAVDFELKVEQIDILEIEIQLKLAKIKNKILLELLFGKREEEIESLFEEYLEVSSVNGLIFVFRRLNGPIIAHYE